MILEGTIIFPQSIFHLILSTPGWLYLNMHATSSCFGLRTELHNPNQKGPNELQAVLGIVGHVEGGQIGFHTVILLCSFHMAPYSSHKYRIMGFFIKY